MANLNYCKFENTTEDLLQCVEALEDGNLPESKTEKIYAKRIAELCIRYIDIYDKEEILGNLI